MYQEFYNLSGKPFSLLPDADFLFLSRRHGRAVNHLEYGTVTEAGFIVITGDVGAGKTTVIRHFLKTVKSDVTVGVINNANAALGSLLSWVASAFELPRAGKDEVELYNVFTDFLIAQYGKGKRVVLVIDEAQNLRRDVLEELRVLSNVNNGKDQLLQIILVGQPELLDVLRQPDMQQFKQRIAVHCHLDPLRPRETADYIRHRLSVVGGAPDIFDSEALAAVHYYSGGVPRLINLLCDQALTYGYSEDQPQIDAKTIGEVVADRASSGLSPFFNTGNAWQDVRQTNEIQALLKDVAAEPTEAPR
jgi:type II secretory pathway predicted ATPase ExeA